MNLSFEESILNNSQFRNPKLCLSLSWIQNTVGCGKQPSGRVNSTNVYILFYFIVTFIVKFTKRKNGPENSTWTNSCCLFFKYSCAKSSDYTLGWGIGPQVVLSWQLLRASLRFGGHIHWKNNFRHIQRTAAEVFSCWGFSSWKLQGTCASSCWAFSLFFSHTICHIIIKLI